MCEPNSFEPRNPRSGQKVGKPSGRFCFGLLRSQKLVDQTRRESAHPGRGADRESCFCGSRGVVSQTSPCSPDFQWVVREITSGAIPLKGVTTTATRPTPRCLIVPLRPLFSGTFSSTHWAIIAPACPSARLLWTQFFLPTGAVGVQCQATHAPSATGREYFVFGRSRHWATEPGRSFHGGCHRPPLDSWRLQPHPARVCAGGPGGMRSGVSVCIEPLRAGCYDGAK